jgi:hypothetical protein
MVQLRKSSQYWRPSHYPEDPEHSLADHFMPNPVPEVVQDAQKWLSQPTAGAGYPAKPFSIERLPAHRLASPAIPIRRVALIAFLAV